MNSCGYGAVDAHNLYQKRVETKIIKININQACKTFSEMMLKRNYVLLHWWKQCSALLEGYHLGNC